MPAQVVEAVPTGLLVNDQLLTSANVALILAVGVSPLLSAQNVDAPAALLRRSLPLLGALLGAILRRAAATCEAARLGSEQAFVLLHGALTYACGDVIAQQALDRRRQGGAAPARRRRLRWRPARTARAAVVGVLSDTLPFYHWSSRLTTLDAASPILSGRWLSGVKELLLRSPAMLLPLKIATHVFTFQPASTAAYLLMMGGWDLLRRKFVAAFAPAFVSFVVGGALVYSLKSVALQVALRNVGVLAICVYLAMVSAPADDP